MSRRYYPLGKRYYATNIDAAQRRHLDDQFYVPPAKQTEPEERSTKRKISEPQSGNKKGRLDIFGGGGKKTVNVNLISPVAQAVNQAKALVAMRRKCKKGACKQRGRSIKGGKGRRSTKRPKSKKKPWHRRKL